MAKTVEEQEDMLSLNSKKQNTEMLSLNIKIITSRMFLRQPYGHIIVLKYLLNKWIISRFPIKVLVLYILKASNKNHCLLSVWVLQEAEAKIELEVKERLGGVIIKDMGEMKQSRQREPSDCNVRYLWRMMGRKKD